MTDKVKRIQPAEGLSTNGSRKCSGLIAIKIFPICLGKDDGVPRTYRVMNSVTRAKALVVAAILSP